MAWTERYISVAGGGAHDGTTAADAWTLAEAIAAYAAGQRLNMLAGTYSNTTTNRTFAAAGSTTQPIWVRGYNTTIGDCDADPTLARPEITFTSGGLSVTGTHHIVSSINGTCTARNNATFSASGSQLRLYRCRFVNQQANAASSAISLSTGSGGMVCEACYFEATTTATRAAQVNIGNVRLLRCHIKSGISNVDGNNMLNLQDCLLRDAVSDAVLHVSNGGQVWMKGCTIRNAGRDGVRFGTVAAGAPGWSFIEDNVFAVVAGVGIQSVWTTSNTNHVYRSGNAFYATTGGQEGGLGDSPAFGAITLGSDPHTSTTDLSLVSGSTARAVQFAFENLSTTVTYPDKGAVQHLDAGSPSYVIGG